jgi:hypothetical protein
VDGDGSIYDPDKGTLYLSGQLGVVSAWATWCGTVTKTPEVVNMHQQPGCWVGNVRFKEAAYTIIKTLYSDCSVFLDRKMATAILWDKKYQTENPGLAAGVLAP